MLNVFWNKSLQIHQATHGSSHKGTYRVMCFKLLSLLHDWVHMPPCFCLTSPVIIPRMLPITSRVNPKKQKCTIPSLDKPLTPCTVRPHPSIPDYLLSGLISEPISHTLVYKCTGSEDQQTRAPHGMLEVMGWRPLKEEKNNEKQSQMGCINKENTQ